MKKLLVIAAVFAGGGAVCDSDNELATHGWVRRGRVTGGECWWNTIPVTGPDGTAYVVRWDDGRLCRVVFCSPLPDAWVGQTLGECVK